MYWKDGNRFSPESVELELSCGLGVGDVKAVRFFVNRLEAGSGEAFER
jgi:hypothetical protein